LASVWAPLEKLQKEGETGRKKGHRPGSAGGSLAIQGHLAETREQAVKEVQYGLEKWIAYAHDIGPAPNPPPRGLADPVSWMNEHGRALIGTPLFLWLVVDTRRSLVP